MNWPRAFSFSHTFLMASHIVCRTVYVDVTPSCSHERAPLIGIDFPFASRFLLFYPIFNDSIQDSKHKLKQCHASAQAHTLNVGYALNGVFMVVISYECVCVLVSAFLVEFGASVNTGCRRHKMKRETRKD